MSAREPRERSSIARLAANASWAKTVGWTARTANARAARWRQYEDQVDPERTLPAHERQKRAEKAMQVYMQQMSRKGVRARREKSAKPGS
jgi:hypothetical protein